MSPIEMNSDTANVVRAAVKGCQPDGVNCCLIINIFFPDDVCIKQECEQEVDG